MPDVPDSVSDHGRRRQFISRRKFWMEAGMGIGGLALIHLISQESCWPPNASAPLVSRIPP